MQSRRKERDSERGRERRKVREGERRQEVVAARQMWHVNSSRANSKQCSQSLPTSAYFFYLLPLPLPPPRLTDWLKCDASAISTFNCANVTSHGAIPSPPSPSQLPFIFVSANPIKKRSCLQMRKRCATLETHPHVCRGRECMQECVCVCVGGKGVSACAKLCFYCTEKWNKSAKKCSNLKRTKLKGETKNKKPLTKFNAGKSEIIIYRPLRNINWKRDKLHIERDIEQPKKWPKRVAWRVKRRKEQVEREKEAPTPGKNMVLVHF